MDYAGLLTTLGMEFVQMTDDKAKPREWWIQKERIGRESGVRYPASVEEIPTQGYIHVIEKSAYDAVVWELDNTTGLANRFSNDLRCAEAKIDRLQSQVKVLREALELCKTQFELIHPEFKHMMAWQKARQALSEVDK